MPGQGPRWRATISFTPDNPDAVTVWDTLKTYPKGKRSEAILSWAARYLAGEQRQGEAATAVGLDEDDLDAKLDAF
jgi:hypothetical protein